MFGHTFLPDKRVEPTPEFYRIGRLPRRQWNESTGREMSALLTPLLAKPGGTMTLRPIQAMALHDVGVCGGGFLPVPVGMGKTLISLLAPYVLGLKKPLLLVPAKLKEKTRREMRELAKHWRIPYERLRIESIELLGRHQAADMLDNYRPDGVIVDEVHMLKNPKAAVTKRMRRFMAANPETVFVGMSGTITKRSLKDYAHILEWCLPRSMPIPRGWSELEKWSSALDEKVAMLARVHPGSLLDWAGPEDGNGDEVEIARRAFRRRLTETQGVVATTENFTGSSLYVNTDLIPRKLLVPGSVEGAFTTLRMQDTTPDGWILPDGMSKWRVARELALGFFYVWDPRPPEAWSIPRQAWGKVCREILKSNRMNLDSEFQVAQAIAQGRIRDEDARHAYATWKAVEETFTPNSKAVWLDDSVIDHCAEWLRHHPHGILWVEHVAFGERLAERTGLPFFQRLGKTRDGREWYHPETAPGGYRGPAIASIASNGTGRNLQFWWHDNYIVSLPPNGLQIEQLIGRTHRDGQDADTVSVRVFVGCIEHWEGLQRAQNDARYIQDSTGQAQKLLYADITCEEYQDVAHLPSRRFQR